MAEMESNDPGMNEPAPGVPGNPIAEPAAVTKVLQKRRRRLVLKIIGVGLLLIVLLILALPTIISTGAARSIILGQVNKRLNGKVEIASLSLGWFTGVKVQGVRVFNADGAQIAELDHLTFPFPLWKGVTGKFALGESVVEGLSFDARYDQTGQLNFAQLVKTNENVGSSSGATAQDQSSGKPSRLPDISGDFKLVNCRGTVSKIGKPTLYLTRLDGEVKIPDINQPVSDQLTAAVRVGNEPQGSISLSGSAAVVSKNQLALDSGDVHQKLTATNIDLQSLKPLLPDSIEKIDGTIGLQLSVDLTGGKEAALDLSLNASKPVAIGGPIFSGDTFTTEKFEIQLPKITADFPEGAGHWQSGRIKTAGDAKPLLVKIDQGQVSALADLTVQSILNLMENRKPGSTGELALATDLDLAKTFPQLSHLIPQQPGTTIQSGEITENVRLAMTPENAVLSERIASTRIVGTRTVGNGPAQEITIDPIEVSLNATDLGGGGALPDLEKLDLKIVSKAANGEFQGQTLSNLNGALTINLNVLRDELSQILDLKDKTLAGSIVVKMSELGDLTRAPFKTVAQMTMTGTGLHYADTVTHQKMDQPLVELEANADLQGSAKQTVEKINKLLVTLKTGDAASPAIATFSVTDATVAAAATSLLDQFNAAHWQVDVPNLKPVMELADAFSTPMPASVPKPDPKATMPLPPVQYISGTIAVSGDLAREGSKLKLTIGKAAATGVAFYRGPISYAAKPISVNLLATVETGEGKSVMEQIREVEIQQLNGDLGIATLSMPTPIVISQFASHPTANGSVKLVGNLTDLTQLLAALQGEKPEALPYRGDYALTENIGSQQGILSLKGGLQIAKFQSFNGSVITFSEDLFALSNDIALTPAGYDESVAINDLSASMQSSRALHLELKNGSVTKLLTDRNLQLQPTIDYDLAKLWPILQPMMGEKYKTLKITGQFKKQFNITGSYPAGLASTEAIKTVHADGDLAVATFDYDGLNLQNFFVPFTLENGKLVTVYANKPAGQNTAPPAVANGGTMDLSNWTIDLTQEPMRLSIPANKAVISKLSVNPLFANFYLARVIDNPTFTGNNGASGLFDLTVIRCVDVPLGDLLTEAVPANTGKADLVFSLTNLNIGFEGIPDLGNLLKDKSFTANVKDGTVSIAGGFSTQHISFVTGKYSMTFDGRVRLFDEMYAPQLNCSIGPLSEIAQRMLGVHDQNILKQLNQPFTIAIQGTVEHSHIDSKKVFNEVKDLVAKVGVKGLLNGLLNKGNKKKN